MSTLNCCLRHRTFLSALGNCASCVAELDQGYPNQSTTTNADATINKLEKAVKLDTGKPPISLIPAEFIEGTAAVFTFGGKKYGANNFRKGLNHSRCIDAVLRHTLAMLRGEILDPESGLPHLYHASCSLAMLDYMRLHYPELNDIYEQIKDKT